MTSDRDDDLARRYRALAREEPPAALDAAILAAGRRAVALQHPGLRRWAAPLSMAAVLILSVGVVVRMQLESPGLETSAPIPVRPPSTAESPPAVVAPVESAAAPARAGGSAAPANRARAAAKPQARPAAPEAAVKRESPAQAAPAQDFAASTLAAPPPPAAAASANLDAGPARAASAEKRSASGAAAADTMVVPVAPEAELERIAKLREAGRDDEADRALDTFRRDHPGYRIPEAQWNRVKARTP